jgi:CBS domain-containing protein
VSIRHNVNLDLIDRTYVNPPLQVDLQTSLREALELLKQNRRGHLLICEEGRLAGIFTERDFLHLIAQQSDLDRPIQEVMTSTVDYLSPDDTVATSIARMTERGYRHIPVADADLRPVGVSRVSGILRYLVEYFPNIVYNLPPQPHHTTQDREGA